MHQLHLPSMLRKLPLPLFQNHKGTQTNAEVDLLEILMNKNELEASKQLLAVTWAGRVGNDEVFVDNVLIDCVLFLKLLYHRQLMQLE